MSPEEVVKDMRERRYTVNLFLADMIEIVYSPGLEKFSPRIEAKFRRGLATAFERGYISAEQNDEINKRILAGKK